MLISMLKTGLTIRDLDNTGINQSTPNFDNTAFYTDWATVSVFMNLVTSDNFYVVLFSYTCTTIVTVYRDLSTVKMYVTFEALLCMHWHPALMCVYSTYAASLSLLINAHSSYCFPIIAYQECAIVIINSCMPTEMTACCTTVCDSLLRDAADVCCA